MSEFTKDDAQRREQLIAYSYLRDLSTDESAELSDLEGRLRAAQKEYAKQQEYAREDRRQPGEAVKLKLRKSGASWMDDESGEVLYDTDLQDLLAKVADGTELEITVNGADLTL
jgi:hypothetical protein